MGAGPTQGAHSAPPQATPTDPVTRSGPPATAPSESASFRKITPGNLGALDAAIDRDLSTFKKDPNSAVDAHYNLQIEVEAAIKSGLPRNLKIDSRYEERLQDIGRRLVAKHGNDPLLADTVDRVVSNMIRHLADAQRAAVTTQRILLNPTRDDMIALAHAYEKTFHDGSYEPNGMKFKEAIKNDPGYRQIINAEAKKCFAAKDSRTVVLNIHLVLESEDIDPKLKRDFLTAVRNYARSNNVVLPLDVLKLENKDIDLPSER